MIDEPHYNQDHQDYDPCGTCKHVIDDLLASYEDRPAIPDDTSDEGELLDPEILEGLYPTTYDPFETEESS